MPGKWTHEQWCLLALPKIQAVSIGLVESPVWTGDNCDLEIFSTRAGKRKHVQDRRRSTDIKVVFGGSARIVGRFK
jgi:hypothetical protein